jgi:hypothetical protein
MLVETEYQTPTSCPVRDKMLVGGSDKREEKVNKLKKEEK